MDEYTKHASIESNGICMNRGDGDDSNGGLGLMIGLIVVEILGGKGDLNTIMFKEE